MNDDIEYPIGIKKTFYNSSSRRKNGRGAKRLVIYYLDKNMRFHTSPITWLEAHFGGLKMFRRVSRRCRDCGTKAHGVIPRSKTNFLNTREEIICFKCQIESP